MHKGDLGEKREETGLISVPLHWGPRKEGKQTSILTENRNVSDNIDRGNVSSNDTNSRRRERQEGRDVNCFVLIKRPKAVKFQTPFHFFG